MRTIYLIRHGEPAFPGGERCCLGRTDLPLSALGRLQAALAGAALEDAGLTAAFCSALSRSRETAALLGPPVTALEGLEELDAGDWDGLTFREIRAGWPEVWARRGEDPGLPIPGAEDAESGRWRFTAALARALDASAGDVAVVSHASVMQHFLCGVLGLPPARARSLALPYGSVTRLTLAEGRYAVGEIGRAPLPEPDAALCARLLDAAGTPERAVAHSRAVAGVATELVFALAAAGRALDERLVWAGAMLHDLARAEPAHAARGAAWLEALGYERLAGIVRQHHDPEDPAEIDEAAVVFLADKLVLEDGRVTLAERFAASRAACATPEAIAAHERRYAAALAAAGSINNLCGKDIVL